MRLLVGYGNDAAVIDASIIQEVRDEVTLMELAKIRTKSRQEAAGGPGRDNPFRYRCNSR
jgi:hypothetical protein